MAAAMRNSGVYNSSENQVHIGQNVQLTRDQIPLSDKDLIILYNEFYKDREIVINNLPDGTPEVEVQCFLGDYTSKSINISENGRHAVVVLENGEETGEFLDKMERSLTEESTVNVSIRPCQNLLCIAHLPHNFSDQQLRDFVSPIGSCKKCFIYRTAESGSKRWYGFVEFDGSVDEVKSIQKELDWRETGGLKVHCDIVNPELVKYQQLNSKCLFIDNLPKDYCDVADFREFFSCHSRPLYCQIVMKDGESLGYGIIQYKTWQEAEKSEQTLNGRKINNVAIRITYCIPGMSAVAICTRIMNKYENMEVKSKPSLLPDPVCPSKEIVNHPLIYELSKQHPNLVSKFDQCLQELQKQYIKQLTTRTDKPGLLGPAPVMPMNPLMNYNLQFGLITLLALQFQSQAPPQVRWSVNLMDLLWQHLESAEPDDGTSILGDPLSAQANIILQNLVSQLVPSNADASEKASPQKLMEKSVSSMLQTLSKDIQSINLHSLASLGRLALQLNTGQSQPSGVLGSDPQSNGNSGLPSLMSLNVQKYSGADGLLGAAPKNVAPNTGQNFLHNLNMFSREKGLLQSTGGLASILEKINQSNGGSSLLGEPPPEVKNWLINRTSGVGAGMGEDSDTYPSSFRSGVVKKKLDSSYSSPFDQGYYEDDGYSSYTQEDEGHYNQRSDFSKYQNTRNFDISGNQSNKYQDIASQAALYAASKTYGNYGYGNYGSSQDYGSYSSMYRGQGQEDSFSSSSGYNTSRNYDDSYSIGRGSLSESGSYKIGRGSLSESGSYNIGRGSLSESGSYNIGRGSLSESGSYNMGRGSLSESGYKFTPNPPKFDFSSTPKPPQHLGMGMMSAGRSYSSSGSGSNQMTPAGQKRSYSQLLPPPEPSPEGDYVGQHSQGIGGHYAETYTNKRRKLDNFGRLLQY
ncbi:hypothetical protein FSP39_009128 [Pinctada imbricata]|uniref:RRM domain-containing protein n=1 Tax=Pinctada imbricata TaxID=66713 RepID=A0AA88XX88_PINIB|nr:hypothetical protein FSP39_009128 [Pinctada imbricata]